MIQALFAILLCLALLLVWLGYYSKEGSYSLIGWTFVFLLSISVLIPGQLQLPSGQFTNTTYTYSGTNLTNTLETSTNTYTNFSDNTSRAFGVWLTMVSIAGFIASLNTLKPFYKKTEEEEDDQ